MAPQTPIALESDRLKQFAITPHHNLATAAAVIVTEMLAANYQYGTVSGVVLNNGIPIFQCVLPARLDDKGAINLQQWLNDYHHQKPFPILKDPT